MSPKCRSVLLLAILVIYVTASVQGDTKFGEDCDRIQNQKRCEMGKGLECNLSNRKCSCMQGTYSQEKMKCVQKMGEKCGLDGGDTSFVECDNMNAKCELSMGKPNYGKCICKEGEDCSSGSAFGPGLMTIVLSMAVATFMRM